MATHSLRGVRGWILAVAIGLAALLPSVAHAEKLNSLESERLGRGETVIREQNLVRGDKQYVGGVTYTVIDANAAELAALFDDVDAYRKVLPKTKRANLLETHGDTRTIELVQGNAMVEATYAIIVQRQSANEYRFWVDPSRPHEIDDAWGFFRLEPFQTESGEAKVLLTYGVLVDVGPGIVRDLFEERVRAALLGVPQQVRRHVADRAQVTGTN